MVFMRSIAKLWPKKREESMPGWDLLGESGGQESRTDVWDGDSCRRLIDVGLPWVLAYVVPAFEAYASAFAAPDLSAP